MREHPLGQALRARASHCRQLRDSWKIGGTFVGTYQNPPALILITCGLHATFRFLLRDQFQGCTAPQAYSFFYFPLCSSRFLVRTHPYESAAILPEQGAHSGAFFLGLGAHPKTMLKNEKAPGFRTLGLTGVGQQFLGGPEWIGCVIPASPRPSDCASCATAQGSTSLPWSAVRC